MSSNHETPQRFITSDTELVSFDLWLTLIKSAKDENGHAPFKEARNERMRQLFAPAMAFEQFDDITKAQDKLADEIAETRSQDVLFDERVRMVAAAVGTDSPGDEQLQDLYAQQGELFQQYHPVLIDQDTPEYLDELKARGIQLAVVSNTGYMHADQMRPLLDTIGIGQKFDYTVFSNEVGYAKPSPIIFQHLIDQSGVVPERITHIGDNPRADKQGALAMGMRAIHLTGDVTLRSVMEESRRGQ